MGDPSQGSILREPCQDARGCPPALCGDCGTNSQGGSEGKVGGEQDGRGSCHSHPQHTWRVERCQRKAWMVRPGCWQVSALRSDAASGADTGIMNISVVTAVRGCLAIMPSTIVQGWCLAL